MSVWTREELTALLAEWKTALKLAATGKSYTIGANADQRTLTRYDLPEIRKMIDWLQGELAELDGKKRLVFVQGRYRGCR